MTLASSISAVQCSAVQTSPAMPTPAAGRHTETEGERERSTPAVVVAAAAAEQLRAESWAVHLQSNRVDAPPGGDQPHQRSTLCLRDVSLDADADGGAARPGFGHVGRLAVAAPAGGKDQAAGWTTTDLDLLPQPTIPP